MPLGKTLNRKRKQRSVPKDQLGPSSELPPVVDAVLYGTPSRWQHFKKSELRNEAAPQVLSKSHSHALYKYIGPKVYAIWVHGPLNPKPLKSPYSIPERQPYRVV